MPGVRTVVLALLTAATGICLGACGDGSGTAPGDGASPTTAASTTAAPTKPAPTATPPLTGTIVRLGPGDSGRTVTLAVGDRLVVTLSGGRLAGSWALASYPRDVLRVDLRSVPPGGVGFLAQAAGSGEVVLVRPLCGPVVDPPCPGGGSGVGPAPTAPTRWAVTVVVR